jgi:hypothetical protein
MADNKNIIFFMAILSCWMGRRAARFRRSAEGRGRGGDTGGEPGPLALFGEEACRGTSIATTQTNICPLLSSAKREG